MKPIERLLIWLVPTQILITAFGIARNFVIGFERADHSHLSTYAAAIFLSSIVYYLANVVIGIWIYRQEHNSTFQRWLWLGFGISTGFWALGVYLLVQIPGMAHFTQDRIAQNNDGSSA